MGLLRDYIAYAREHVQPKLTDEAQQRLIQAYVDMRKIGSGRGQISAYPRQLESLIRLAEAHAKVRLSQKVENVDVEEAWRLHREALKQSATDPLSGKIDVGILTTGLSATARKKRADLIAFIKDILKKKNKTKTIPYQKFFSDVKENSQIVSEKDDRWCSYFLSFTIYFSSSHVKTLKTHSKKCRMMASSLLWATQFASVKFKFSNHFSTIYKFVLFTQ